MEGKSFDSGLILPTDDAEVATGGVAETPAVATPKEYAKRVKTFGKRTLCETILDKEASKDFREWLSDTFGGNIGPGTGIEMTLEATQLGLGHKVKMAVYGNDDDSEDRFKVAMAKKFWRVPLSTEDAEKFKKANPNKPLPVIHMTWDYFLASQKQFAKMQAQKEVLIRTGERRQFVYR